MTASITVIRQFDRVKELLMENATQKHNKYLVLLVDRKRARMFTMNNGVVEHDEEIIDEFVPQKVKHGDDTWDAQDKIFRHIEDHLHRHLALIAKRTAEYVKKERITDIVIGSHKPLLPKVKKHLPYPLNKKVRGTFLVSLKAPLEKILKKTKEVIDKIELEEKRNTIRRRYGLPVS